MSYSSVKRVVGTCKCMGEGVGDSKRLKFRSKSKVQLQIACQVLQKSGYLVTEMPIIIPTIMQIRVGM